MMTFLGENMVKQIYILLQKIYIKEYVTLVWILHKEKIIYVLALYCTFPA